MEYFCAFTKHMKGTEERLELCDPLKQSPKCFSPFESSERFPPSWAALWYINLALVEHFTCCRVETPTAMGLSSPATLLSSPATVCAALEGSTQCGQTIDPQAASFCVLFLHRFVFQKSHFPLLPLMSVEQYVRLPAFPALICNVQILFWQSSSRRRYLYLQFSFLPSDWLSTFFHGWRVHFLKKHDFFTYNLAYSLVRNPQYHNLGFLVYLHPAQILWFAFQNCLHWSKCFD